MQSFLSKSSANNPIPRAVGKNGLLKMTLMFKQSARLELLVFLVSQRFFPIVVLPLTILHEYFNSDQFYHFKKNGQNLSGVGKIDTKLLLEMCILQKKSIWPFPELGLPF